ncbi:MAG: tRNA threonylcarbamoyladenosine dehydratase [Clostridia bacterium]|nr:tRNA threonylcarbamoyladenosine dehydratase [Clostridia bacterium]
MIDEAFSRTALLIGESGVETLQKKRVCVFGVGGVGGYVVEALARAGVGALDVVDNDTVARSNLNRQIIATLPDIGRRKVDVVKERIERVSPSCQVTRFPLFMLPDTPFDFTPYDYVVDAIDTVSGKLAIVKGCKDAGVPVISSMGAGNKLDPTAFRVADISKTKVCPLAKVMRRLCRENDVQKLKVVYSEELPVKQSENGLRVPASISFVPSVAGLILAGEVIKDLLSADR